MIFSLNEIEATGKRAARGAGFSWGLAEEVGKAARWLSAYGLPGPEILADLLRSNDGVNYDDLAPISAVGVWEAPAGLLCPLVAGAAISDRAADIAAGHQIRLGTTAHPLLLAPFVSSVAYLAQMQAALSWDGVVIGLNPTEVKFEGKREALTTQTANSVVCQLSGVSFAGERPAEKGRDVDADTWSILNKLAGRTYAPATEASRLTGAGAGLNDND